MQDQTTLEALETPNEELKQLIRSGLDISEHRGSVDPVRTENLHLWSGWKRGVALSCICSIVVLIFNSALLIWARSRPVTSDGNYILQQGAYETLKTFDTTAHLIINILSTIILAGSNYALQVLVAPTRKDIDRAHHKNRSMDVGVSSFRNWHYLSLNKKILYIGLFVVTIPIHVLYNSIIISTAVTFEYYHGDNSGVVTKDFLEIPPGNASLSRVWDLATNNKLTNISTDDCSQLCLEGICEYSIIILFTNLSSTSQNSSWYYTGLITTPYYDQKEECTEFSPPGSWLYSADFLPWSIGPRPWQIAVCTTQNSSNAVIHSAGNEYLTYVGVDIEYCLVKNSRFSTIELIPQLLVIVMVCNVLKIGALCFLLFSHHKPMVTIGDAITSFLASPDSVTRNLGPISAMELQKLEKPVPLLNIYKYNKAWKGKGYCYFDAPTPGRWWSTLGLCIGYWSIGLIILCSGPPSASDLQQQWSLGLENPLYSHIARDLTLAQSILLANIPQLVLSAIYLCYNALFTYISLSLEWLSYCKHRKGLRVTTPEGEQRSTYFLSLPYKVSLPLGIASMLLHWMLSLSIFVVRVDIYNSDEILIPGIGSHTVGTSTAAFIVGLILGGFLIYGLIVVGFGKLDSAMPLVRSESMAISAACHPVNTSGQHISTKKLQYGVISELPSGRYRVGFSDREVRPLIPGEFYE